MGIVPATYGIRSGGLSRADIIRIIEAEIAKAGTGTGLDAAGAQAIIAAMLKEGASVDLSLNTEKTELTISVDSDSLTIPVREFAASTAYIKDAIFKFEDEIYSVVADAGIPASNTSTVAQLLSAGTIKKLGGDSGNADAERNIFRGGWVAGAYKSGEVVVRNRYLFRYTEDIPSNNTTPPESDSRAQRLIAANPDDLVKITGNANVLTLIKRDGTTSTITIEIAGMAEEVGRDLFIADYAVSDMATQDADADTEFDFTGETLVQGSAPQVTLDTTADTITINKKGAYAIAVEMKVTDEGTSGNSRLNAIIEYQMNGGTWHTLTSSVYVRPLTPNESVLHASTDVLFAQNDVVKFRYHGDIGTSGSTPRISISEISLRLFERPLKVNSTDDAIADKTAATPEENDLVTFADKSDSNKEKSTEIKNVLALLGVGIKDWTPLVTTGTQFLANASNTAVASATLAFSNSVYVPVPDGFLFYLEFEIGGATVESAAFSVILPTLPQVAVPSPPFNLDGVHGIAYEKNGSGSEINVEHDGNAVRDFNVELALGEALTGSHKANFAVLGILKVTRNS